MANPYFQFKQFTVRHDRCGMKVGTDGVLLGAWSPIGDAQFVLDIGAGSGLVALMLAQRSSARIVAVELDEAAAIQAKENIEASPWLERMEVAQGDILSFSSDILFDLIVSNPPFFDLSLQSPDQKRTRARHTEGLSYDALLRKSAELLSPRGRICLIVPADKEQKIDELAQKNRLFPIRKTYVLPKPDAQPKRLLLELSVVERPLQTDELVIELARHQYSEGYISLTRDFYLKHK
jgi:tRNA1Val (adenine37-N6)-methyltransferase